jgi:hypothetical protein
MLDNEQLHPLRRIKQTVFIVPYREGNPARNGRLELGAMVIPNGERYVAAFTCMDELEKGPYINGKATLFSFDELKREVFNGPSDLSGIVINPLSKRIFLKQKLILVIDLLNEYA